MKNINDGNFKIAIVYDWIDKWGGVERVLLNLHKLYPRADFYTSYVDLKNAQWAKDLSIKTSFIQKLPSFIRKNRILSLLLYPYAFESFDFGKYDLVISITSSFAKGIITKPQTKHLCYLLTPTRFLWVYPQQYIKKLVMKIFGSFFVSKLRTWDYIAAQRPDKYVAISNEIKKRCEKYYKREASVVYPGFNIEYWTDIKNKMKKDDNQLLKQISLANYYLVVSRLEPYKQVDKVIHLFNTLHQPLVIVGKGSLREKMHEIANRNIHFFEDATDEELAFLYANAKGLIMMQEEDFGYVSLEAQFFGCPVIAYKNGGASETVLHEKTGYLFDRQTEECLSDSIACAEKISYNDKRIFEHQVKKFDQAIFEKSFQSSLEELLKTDYNSHQD